MFAACMLQRSNEKSMSTANTDYLGAGHAPLGGAVHEGGDGQAAGTLAVPLAEELLLQLVCPPLVGSRRRCQVPNVSTLQHHLHM